MNKAVKKILAGYQAKCLINLFVQRKIIFTHSGTLVLGFIKFQKTAEHFYLFRYSVFTNSLFYSFLYHTPIFAVGS